jgi:hypothetical protein
LPVISPGASHASSAFASVKASYKACGDALITLELRVVDMLEQLAI